MRATVTLHADLVPPVRRRAQNLGIPFEQALDDLVRSGVEPARSAFHTQVAAMGAPAVDLDRALQVAADLDDRHCLAPASPPPQSSGRVV